MPSRIRRKKKYKFSVFIFYLVDIFYPVCSLHFVSTGLILLFLFERASSPDRNIGARKEILVRLSWPLWLMCGLYVEELPRKSTMIEQWLLYTNWRRTQMRGLTIWLPLVPFCVVTTCVEMNISAFDSTCIFRSSGRDLRLLFLLNHTNFISFHVSFWASSKFILTFWILT